MSLLLVNTVVACVSGIFLLSYAVLHKNSKNLFRVCGGVVLMYFAGIQLAAYVGIVNASTYGAEYIRPWLWVLYLVPALDAWVD